MPRRTTSCLLNSHASTFTIQSRSETFSFHLDVFINCMKWFKPITFPWQTSSDTDFCHIASVPIWAKTFSLSHIWQERTQSWTMPRLILFQIDISYILKGKEMHVKLGLLEHMWVRLHSGRNHIAASPIQAHPGLITVHFLIGFADRWKDIGPPFATCPRFHEHRPLRPSGHSCRCGRHSLPPSCSPDLVSLCALHLSLSWPFFPCSQGDLIGPHGWSPSVLF